MPGEARQKPRELDLTLLEVIAETKDTSTLVFEKPADAPPYKAGQFLTLEPRQFAAVRSLLGFLEHEKGKKELARAYSLSSAPHEPTLAVTVKEEPYSAGVTRYPPLLSPLLVYALGKGLHLQAVGFTGPYVLPDDVESKTDHLVHVVAGSGAVPNFSILKDSLRAHPGLRHTFIDSNKTFEDICFRGALEQLEREHPERLKVVHTLTREPNDARFQGQVRRGRITPELFQELIPDLSRCLIYVCGPAITAWERRAALETRVPAKPRFLEMAMDYLQQLGVPKAQIKREAYG